MPLVVHRRRPAMGTWFEAWLVGDDAEHLAAVAGAALDEVERVERLLSRFDPCSEVGRLNREAPSRAVRVDYELVTVLRACRLSWQRTGGTFDPTAGAARTGFSAVVVDEERRTVRFATEGLALDFGGFGKGYALDRAADVLHAFGVRSALLHGGTSSVLALGRDWPVALRDSNHQPLPPGEVGRASVRVRENRQRLCQAGRGTSPSATVVTPHPPAARATSPGGRGSQSEDITLDLSDRALSCSSVFAPNCGSSDLIDPHTGQPLREAAVCVVLDHSAAEAESLSTALLVMGRTRAALYAQREAREGLAIAWIEPNSGPEWLTGAP